MTTITERRQAHEDDSDNVRAPLLATQVERAGYRAAWLKQNESLRRISELIEPWEAHERRLGGRPRTHSALCHEWHIECLLLMLRAHLGEK